jgi:hypothetical protein
LLEKVLGCRVDAIVGMDVLRKTSFTIDYESKQILFGPIQDMRFSVPFESDPPFVTVRMTLQNRSARLLIDTGDPAVMLFQSQLHDSKGLQDVGNDIGTNLAGQFQRRRVRVSEIALGKEKLSPQIIFIVNDKRTMDVTLTVYLGLGAFSFAKSPLTSNTGDSGGNGSALRRDRRRWCPCASERIRLRELTPKRALPDWPLNFIP